MKRLLTVILTCMFIHGVQAIEITRYVKQGGTGKGTSWADACGSINQALDAIKVAGNGTVYIGPGNYTESVVIPNGSKNVNMLGGYSENNMEKPERDRVFITEGKYDITKTVNAALEVGWNGENIRVSGINIVKGNTGIVMRGTNIVVDSCVVSGCNTGITEDGGGKNFTVRNCVISNCSNVGIRLNNANIFNSTVKENGLGLYVTGCYIYNCAIIDNVHVSQTRGFTTNGGGIRMSQTVVSRSYIANNRCDGEGGGLHVSGSGYHSFIFQCIIANNTARDGGGIYADEQVFSAHTNSKNRD